MKRSRRCSTWPRRNQASSPNVWPPRFSAYAENVDKLQNLTAPVLRMAARHVEVGVKPEHYPIVAENLLPAIRDVLGDAATDEVLDAWGQAYWFLADILIAKEAGIYAQQEAA